MMYSFLEVYHGDNRGMMNELTNNPEKMNYLYELMSGQGNVSPEDYETMGQLDNTNRKKKSTTLDEQDLENLSGTFDVGDSGTYYCQICLEYVPKNTKMRRLLCTHSFCKECIDTW